jgi:multidrug efflux pump subunit AcrA (membrane-fusion protein)
MKRLLWTSLLVLSVLLSACGTPTPTAAPVITGTPAAKSASAPPAGTIVASGVVSPAQVTEIAFAIPGAVSEVSVKEGDVVGAGQMLIRLDSTEFDSAVAQAEAVLKGQQREYEFWLPSRKGENPERRWLEETKVETAKAALTLAQAQLTQTTLTAPADSIVVKVNIKAGEYAQPGQVVILLASLDRLRIETTDLSERDIPAVQVGQKAAVFIEALGQELTGQVIAIAPRANTVGGDVVFKVTIDLDNPPETLRWGMSAEVNIAAEP